LICAVAIARLEEPDQRVAIAYLMAAIKPGELAPIVRPH
jgi:hypothetical protein